MSTFPSPAALASLVRLPAILTVPGDVALGAAAAGPVPPLRRRVLLTAASVLTYWSGMALNDWADREVDARERPERPIPSGLVTPGFALAAASGLGLAALGLAAVASPRALAVHAPLLVVAWAYDLALKDTAIGPAAMAGCRFLDVLSGATEGRMRAALPVAGVVAGHTWVVSRLSSGEAGGASPELARKAMWGTGAVAAAAAPLAGGLARRSPRDGPATVWAGALPVALLGAYAASVGRAQAAAGRLSTPRSCQAAVGASVLALPLLEGCLVAAAGKAGEGVALFGAWLAGRTLARRRPVS